jgi:NSS family neurotransmitter:Na+ symporter
MKKPPESAGAPSWSSRFTTYLATAGAAVGLGSVWRFPYLTGVHGGSAFILIFVLACVLIAMPLIASEFALGRRSRRSPPEAAGAVGAEAGLSTRWNAIGILGSVTAFLMFSYYTVIAGWVMAYAWKCAAGVLAAAGPHHTADLARDFQSNTFEIGAWHIGFLALVVLISARGVHRGIEAANRVRAPALLILLCVLVVYALMAGDVTRGLSFAFKPNFAVVNSQVVLAAIGQAFYATGVGQAMMMAYGAYMTPGTSLIRTSLVTTGSILLVSTLATLMVFPLVFAYGMDPAQGTQLVFEVLPRAFIEMPGGRVIGTLFFVLLVLAALMPSVALLEPTVAWLTQRRGLSRAGAVGVIAVVAWVLGLGSVFSFNLWSAWHPLGFVPLFAQKTLFDLVDYLSANLMLPVGALLTSVFVGWRLSEAFLTDELADSAPFVVTACRWLLRYVCPIAIVAVFIATLS